MSPPFVTAVYMEKKDYLRRCQKNACLMCMCLYAYVYQVLKNKFICLRCGEGVSVCTFLMWFYISNKSFQFCSVGNYIGLDEKMEVRPWRGLEECSWRNAPRSLSVGDSYIRVLAVLLLDMVGDEETTTTGTLILFLHVGLCRL